MQIEFTTIRLKWHFEARKGILWQLGLQLLYYLHLEPFTYYHLNFISFL